MGLEKKALQIGMEDCTLQLSPYSALSFSATPAGYLSGVRLEFTSTHEELEDIDTAHPLAQLLGLGPGGIMFAPPLYFPPKPSAPENEYSNWSLLLSVSDLGAIAGRLAIECNHAYQAVQQAPEPEYTLSWFLLHDALSHSKDMLRQKSFADTHLSEVARAFTTLVQTQEFFVMDTAHSLARYAPVDNGIRHFTGRLIELHYSP